MPTYAFLFRLLLSFSLLLNGTATASPMMAGMDMHAVSSNRVAQPAATGLTAEGAIAMEGCHGMDMDAHANQIHSARDVLHKAPAPALPDCCRNNSCRCACVHALPLAAPMVEFRAMVLLGVHPVHALRHGHVPPTASPLIRPPIA